MWYDEGYLQLTRRTEASTLYQRAENERHRPLCASEIAVRDQTDDGVYMKSNVDELLALSY